MEPRPIIVITGRQRPHEALILLYSLALGLAYLFGAPQSQAVREVDAWVLDVWGSALALSGILGLLGSYWRGEIRRGLLLERSGMFFNAACILGFAVMVYYYAGSVALFTLGILGTWVAADVVRCVQISNDLRNLRGAARAVGTT